MKAKILRENSNIEEEFLIEISGVRIVAFISYQPQIIKVGEEYDVEDIEFMFDEDLIETYKLIKEVDVEKKEVEIFHDSFRHKITGLLGEDGTLDVGIIFKDEIFFDYAYLFGKYVEMEVLRIDVGFYFNK